MSATPHLATFLDLAARRFSGSCDPDTRAQLGHYGVRAGAAVSARQVSDMVRHLDPAHGPNVPWIVRQLAAPEFQSEGLYFLRTGLKLWFRHLPTLSQADRALDAPGHDLAWLAALRRQIQQRTGTVTPAERGAVSAETTVAYEGAEGIVVIPHTREAACTWGKGTDWCFAERTVDNAFNEFNRERLPRVILVTAEFGKYRWAPSSAEEPFLDALHTHVDNPLPRDLAALHRAALAASPLLGSYNRRRARRGDEAEMVYDPMDIPGDLSGLTAGQQIALLKRVPDWARADFLHRLPAAWGRPDCLRDPDVLMDRLDRLERLATAGPQRPGQWPGSRGPTP